jgi:hypothetical protein
MPTTVVHCSMPGCEEVAVSKVAVPWHYGTIAENQTYGYTCPTHIDSVVACAQQRLDSSHLAPEEAVGELVAVKL